MEKVVTGAVDIGGTKIQIGLVDEKGKLLAEKCIPTNCGGQSAEQAMDHVLNLLTEQCEMLGIEPCTLRGIGISCAGPVNIERGTIENPYTLSGWNGFPIVPYMERHSGLTVKIENDANGALLGEVLQRKLQGKKVLMVTIGTGIGVAFWSGENLYRSGKYHPEMGHIIVSSRKAKCYCGHHGCFESCCSGKALNERARQAGYRDFDQLYEDARQNRTNAGYFIDEAMDEMKNGIWTLNIIFKPDVLILAGGFARKYFSLLKETILEDSIGKEDFVEKFEILPAYENINSALIGANMLLQQ